MDARSLLVFFATTLALSAGCSKASDPSEEEAALSGDAALAAQADVLGEEALLLGGGRAELDQLRAVVDQRLDALDSAKDRAKDQATQDVGGYSAAQWERSFFSRDERDLAVRARSRDIFDRPDRRALDGRKAQKKILGQLAALVDAGRAGTSEEPTDEALSLRQAYVEISLSIALNGELGLVKQAGARLHHLLQKKAPWLARIFKRLRRDHPAPGIEGEARNIDRSGDLDQLWRVDPTSSTVWHRRSPEEITPARLYRGPWFTSAQPKLPSDNEVWHLAGFRSQKSDGSHAAVDVSLGDASIKLKLREADRDFWEDAPHARLLWAMGYETDPQYTLQNVRVEPRAFIAAHASIARIGIRFRDHDDEVIPGRPPRGLSVALHGINRAPGSGFVEVRYLDGHEESGDAAIESLRRATDDRALMDTMESVLVRRAYGEVDPIGERSAIGPWDYDADNHVDAREIRAVAIVMNAWLGSNDLKFNNVRLDVLPGSQLSHVLSDVGGIPKDLPWQVGIDPDGRWLHPDTNSYTIRAFDRMTVNDAKWGVARVAALTEEQIVACLATGAFTPEALALHTEKLLARRDELVRTFHMEAELGLLRPDGPRRSPPPRTYAP